jgi:REP element-mobilizing transposase RayT
MEKAPVKHNRLRRMEKHDYTSACIYLITVTTVDRKRVLGSLVGDSPATAEIEPTALAAYVAEAFRKIAAETTKKTGCRVQVLHYQIMPDHFHGILYVRDTLPADYSLGKIIAAWKSDCSHAYWDSSSSCAQDFSTERKSLFASGFNDRILFRKGQLQTWITYLNDNPRRLWLKVHFPNRLRKVYDFTAGRKGHPYTAVGNTFLVTYPERLQVRCHRHLTEEQIQEEVATYLREARRGTVLVSPFISMAEKAVYDACYKEKLQMIHIVDRGLDGRFIYPSGRDLNGCSDGFMLVLAPYADYSAETAAARITRAQCLDMNGYAADLASITLKCDERDEEEQGSTLKCDEQDEEEI